MAAAAVSALNKFAARVRTRIKQALMERYTLSQADILAGINIINATRANPVVTITGSGKKLGLDHFKISTGAAGVSVEIIRGEAKDRRQAMAAGGSAGSFIIGAKVGRLSGLGQAEVVARETKASLPIHRLVGPSVGDLAASTRIEEVIQEAYNSEFPDILKHEIEFYTSN